MRSDLIFRALTHVANRYQLSRLVAKATSKLHRPGARTQDTTNEVLTHVCGPSLLVGFSSVGASIPPRSDFTLHPLPRPIGNATPVFGISVLEPYSTLNEKKRSLKS